MAEPTVAELQDEIKRLKHINAVLKNQTIMAYENARTIEDHVRCKNGKLEVWFLGDWYDREEEAEKLDGESEGDDAD